MTFSSCRVCSVSPRFAEDLVLPRQKLGAKIFALALVHERLFFGRSIVLQLFQGQPIFHLWAPRLAAPADGKFRPRAPYIAAPCDRQYRPPRKPDRPQGLAQAKLSGVPYGAGPAPLVADRETLADMGRTLDFVGQGDREILKGDPAFSVRGGQKLVGSEPELGRPLARDEQGRGRQEGPVQVLLLGKPVEEGRALLGLGLVLRRKGGRS